MKLDRQKALADLMAMVAEDAATRERLVATPEFWTGYHPEMREVHRRNGDRLVVMLDAAGRWLGHDLVGVDGSEAAWLIAHHDIANPPLMRRARILMQAAVEAGQASGQQLACLVDRIRAFEGRSQLYGTQWGWNDEGRSAVWPPVDDPTIADRRRREVGLPTLASVMSSRRREAAEPPQLSDAELLARRQGEQAFAVTAGWRSA